MGKNLSIIPKLYINELAPWEERKAYLLQKDVHKNILEQTKLLKEGILENKHSQLQAARSIVASQELIADGIRSLNKELNLGLEMIDQGLLSLQSTFEWGMTEIAWHLEQNREVLQDILATLQVPLDTKAKERCNRAEMALSGGLIEEAEEEFLEAEKLNKFDFTIHLNLGFIYLFHKIDKMKALDCFKKAERYAGLKSEYYVAYSLIYQGLVYRDIGEYESGKKVTLTATELCPTMGEAFYQNALFNSLLGNIDQACEQFDHALYIDVGYALKMESDEGFNNARDDIIRLIEMRIKRLRKRVQKRLNRIKESNEKLSQVLKQIRSRVHKDWDDNPLALPHTKINLHEIELLLSRNSLFDTILAQKRLSEKVEALRNNKKFLEQCEFARETMGLQKKKKSIFHLMTRKRKAQQKEIDRLKNMICQLYQDLTELPVRFDGLYKGEEVESDGKIYNLYLKFYPEGKLQIVKSIRHPNTLFKILGLDDATHRQATYEVQTGPELDRIRINAIFLPFKNMPETKIKAHNSFRKDNILENVLIVTTEWGEDKRSDSCHFIEVY